MHLITAATGNIGARVVYRLLDRGERPRIFVRDAARARERFGDRVDVATGDLADPGTLVSALSGIDVIFLLNSGYGLEERDAAAATVAKSAGVRSLVKLSTFDVREGVGTGAWHARGEAAIRSSGIGFTFVQPSGYMDNLLNWVDSIKAEGVVRSAAADGKIPFIHSDDIADVVVEVMASDRFAGASLPITGPQALSFREMTEQLGAALATQLRFESITDDQERRQQIGWGAQPPLVEARLSIFRAIREGRLATVTTEVERVTGHQPITFERWAIEHASSFR